MGFMEKGKDISTAEGVSLFGGSTGDSIAMPLEPLTTILIGDGQAAGGGSDFRIAADFVLAIDDFGGPLEGLADDALVDVVTLTGACAYGAEDHFTGSGRGERLEPFGPERRRFE